MQWTEFRSHIRHLPTRELKRVEAAFILGQKLHDGQKRKSGEAFFSHPIAVAHMLSDLGADSDTIIAALLHDTVEDTDISLREIDAEFNGSVTKLIDGVTKLEMKDVASSPRLNDQMESLRKIFSLMQEDIRIMVIKLIDRLHNMQTIQFLSPERQRGLAEETQEVFVKIADRLCMQELRNELEGLTTSVLEPLEYPRLLELSTLNEHRGMLVIGEMKSTLEKHDRHLASRTELTFEPKSWSQLKHQLSASGTIATGVSFITVCFISEDIDSCYRVLGALHQLWRREVMSFQDFINSPQVNGYRGLHTTVILESGMRIRCKIRTREMHDYARRGIAMKCFDAKNPTLADELPWTNRLSPVTSQTAGSSEDFWASLQSDILGESIVIHGTDDIALSVPKGATALDAAFYLLHEDAIRTSVIRVNGVEVPLITPLQNADTIDVEIGTRKTVSLSWLRESKTSLAAGFIRSALARLPEITRVTIGREMLQRELRSHRRGFLEEFKEEVLLARMHTMQYAYGSMAEVYTAIAEGKLPAHQVYHVLFQSGDGGPALRKIRKLIYSIDSSNVALMDRVNEIHREFALDFREITYKRRGRSPLSTVTVKAELSEADSKKLVEALEIAGIADASLHTSLRSYWPEIAALMMLWGLDSVFASLLLKAGFTVPTLTFTRALTSVLFAGLILIATERRSQLSRLPLRLPTLWVSGLSFFLLSFCTYQMLFEGASPFFYKMMFRYSAIVISLPLLLREKRWAMITLSMGVMLGSLMLILSGGISLRSVVIGITVLGLFGLYTWSSELFQKEAHVGVRYPQFFFAMSTISAIAALVLPLLSDLRFPGISLLLTGIVFTLIFVCLPYIILYRLNREIDYFGLAPFFHASLVITYAGQWLLLGLNDLSLIVPAILLIGMGFLGARRWVPR